jgi:MFS transporter, ACS family, hexuronate transporter
LETKRPSTASANYRWVILAVTLLAQIGSGGATQGVQPLAAFYQQDMQLARAQIGFFISAIATGQVLSLMVSGWMADIFGIRRVMLVGLLALGGALAAFSFARTFEEAFLLLVLAGVASGISMPAIPKSILEWFPPRNRGLAMGVQRTGIPLMGVLAAAILPSVSVASGWRVSIQLLAGTVALLGVITFAVYREGPIGARVPGRRHDRPASPWRLLGNRNILLANALPVALVAAQFSLVSYLVLYLMESLGTPVVVAGGALALAQFGGVVGRVAWGVLSDRLFRGSRKAMLLIIGVTSSLLLLGMGFLPPGIPLWTITPLVFLLGLLTLGWHGVYTLLMPELAGRDQAAGAVGLGYTILQVGTFAGAPLFGLIVDLSGDYRWAWRALALAAAVGTALLLPVRERTGEKTEIGSAGRWAR